MSVSRVKIVKQYFPIESYSYSSSNTTVSVTANNHGLYTGIPVSLTSNIHYSAYNGSANVTSANTFTVESYINPQDLTHFSINGYVSSGEKEYQTLPRGRGIDSIIQTYSNGAGGATVSIDVSLDANHWISLGSMTVSNTNSAFIPVSPSWAYYRANVVSLVANSNVVLISSE
nr:MAG: hypothetical protein [Caudoviricetes sp.]